MTDPPLLGHLSREDLERMLLRSMHMDNRIKALLGDRHYTGHSVEEHVKDLLEEIETHEKKQGYDDGLKHYGNFAGIRATVLDLAREMEVKLQEHDDTRGKQGWLEEEIGYLYEMLQQKYSELSNVIMADDLSAILSKSTDVANFIMMVHDKIREESKNNVKNIPTD